MEHKKWQRMKPLMIVTFVAVGIALGTFFLYTNLNGTKDLLILDFINGKIILDAEDRALLTQEILNKTLEDDQVKAVTAGQNFTTHVTIAKSIQEIETPTNGSLTRIYIEFDYVAEVTLMFEDGSGYTIQVNWEEWTIGDPEYSEHLSPPESIIRIGPSGTRERNGTW